MARAQETAPTAVTLAQSGRVNLTLSAYSYSLQDGSAEPFSRMIRVLEGLGVYLKDFCNEAEREEFFSKTLPFISMSASSLEERALHPGPPTESLS